MYSQAESFTLSYTKNGRLQALTPNYEIQWRNEHGIG